jgi:phosphotransferase system  glucose/maltose/N-acetylglucosamine-specific IIC component
MIDKNSVHWTVNIGIVAILLAVSSIYYFASVQPSVLDEFVGLVPGGVVTIGLVYIIAFVTSILSALLWGTVLRVLWDGIGNMNEEELYIYYHHSLILSVTFLLLLPVVLEMAS